MCPENASLRIYISKYLFDELVCSLNHGKSVIIHILTISYIGVSHMFGINEVDVDTLQSYIDEGKKFRLIDVRGIAEMAQGMIPNAEKLPLHTLPARLQDIDTDEMTILYCRSGARSAQGVGFMAQQGFENVYNLRGGIIAWAQKGMPLMAQA